MTYADGRAVMLGDIVNLAPVTPPAVTDPAWIGTVVCDFDAPAFAAGYESWDDGYLTEGCLVSCKGAGLVHDTDASHDFEFVRRYFLTFS